MIEMRYVLNPNGRTRYSAREKALFELLKTEELRKNPVPNIQLLSKFWKGQELPFNAATVLNGLCRSLRDKIDYNREPFELVRLRENGKREVSWRLQRRQS